MSSATVSKEEYEMLWNEFEEYKKACADVERELQTAGDKAAVELAAAKRALAEERAAKEEAKRNWMDELARAQSSSEEVAALKEEIERISAEKRRLEGETEQLARTRREEQFALQRANSDRDKAMENLVIAQSEHAEALERIKVFERKVAHFEKELEEEKEVGDKRQKDGCERSGDNFAFLVSELKTIAAMCREASK